MDTPQPERVTIRRAPRARAFVLMGIILGVAGVLAAASFFPPDPALGAGLVSGYFVLWGLTVGLVGGLLVWLWADRRSKSRAREVSAERRGPDSDNSQQDTN